MNNQAKLTEILQMPIHCWNGMILKPEVEEDPESIWLAIRYQDHGDDFLLISVNDGTFHRYGYFIDRTCEFVCERDYERKPETYKKPDDRATASNTMYFAFRKAFAEPRITMFGGTDYSDSPKKEYSQERAQVRFDSFLEEVKTMVNGELILHEHNNSFGYNKRSLRRYLEVNGIDTPNNLEKLEKQPFDTRIDGYDGIAGRIRYEYSNVVLDDITHVWVNGKDIDIETVPTYVCCTDEWGVDTMCLALKSYRMSKKYLSQEKQEA